ncbi:MAG TPA: hypothetical protein VGE39_24170 [Prosthecobacter sp.]
MSKIKSPPQKKKLRDEKDHYPGGNGESKRAWRRTKQVKKADARRRFRKAANDAVNQILPSMADETHEPRRRQAIKQPKVREWGVVSVGEFAKTRRRKSKKAQKQAAAGALAP